MCGIAGKVSAGRAVEPELVARMCASLAHRGPDSTGMHVDGPVGLGMRRLAIIDLERGEQPLYSEDGSIVLVFNGEVYNHRPLRAELAERGHRLAGGSDAEVVVHLYEELGARCVERLRGMFAFAIWDGARRRLLLARDRIGKKPLHWALRDGSLLFGSEPRAILQDPSVPREPDPAAIDAFCVNQYVPHGLSAFRGLAKLPPASTLTWAPGGTPRIERWWEPARQPVHRLGADEAAERVRALVLDATRARLEADVPLGAWLSGGIDSSAVVAAMARTSPDTVRTFSVSFPDEGFDESPYARAVAEAYGTEHRVLEVGPVEPELLLRLAWHLGEPLADPAAVPTFQLSELTRAHVTVALSGDGGDEAFAGYRRYRQIALTRLAGALPGRRAAAAALARLAGDAEGHAPLPRAARLARRLALAPPVRYADLMRHLGDDDRARVYGPRLAPFLDADRALAHVEREWNAHAGLGWIRRAAAADWLTYLPDDLLPKVDLTSMAHGLEVRSPLLDHELLEWAARLPDRLLRGRTEKPLLRAAVAPWLPPEVLDRPKHGFAVPIGRWLRGPLRELCEDVLLDARTRDRGLLDPAGVRATLREHAEGRDRSLVLWTLLSLELWLRACIDAPQPGGQVLTPSV